MQYVYMYIHIYIYANSIIYIIIYIYIYVCILYNIVKSKSYRSEPLTDRNDLSWP